MRKQDSSSVVIIALLLISVALAAYPLLKSKTESFGPYRLQGW